MKLRKKALSILLVACLMLTLLPVNAWAADDEANSITFTVEKDVDASEEDENTDLTVSDEVGEVKPDESDESMGEFSDIPPDGDLNLTDEPTGEDADLPDSDVIDDTMLGGENEKAEKPSDVPPDETTGNAQQSDLSAMCGDNLTWTLDYGTLTINGTGPMYDYAWHVTEDLWEYVDTPWYSQRENITQIIVNEGVTTIGANAFAACYNVIDINIADSVTDIGEGAFDGCGMATESMPIGSNEGLMPLDDTTGNVRYSVVVLDVSGSMTSKPMAAQKAAAIKFCESLLGADGSNHVAIVSFGSSAKVVSQFTESIDELTSAINSISAYGSTNTVGALTTADQLLSAIPDTAGRSIVLCSDGLPNTGGSSTNGPFSSSDSSYYYSYANAVYNKTIELIQKYDVFSLGFFHSLSGNDLEFARKFMPLIQNAGYYEVTDPEDLEFTFGDIAGDIVTPGHSGIIMVSVPKDKYVIHVVSEDGKNLQGATVTCNGTIGRTNNSGLAEFDRSIFATTPEITVTASGYIDWTNAHSNWEFDNRGYTTIKMYPTSASQYKLSECVYSNVPGNVSPGINLLTTTKTVSLGNDLPVAGDLDLGNFYLTCKAIKADGIVEYQLWQGTKQIKTCLDGNFGQLSVDKDGFVEGGKCFIRVVGTDGEQADTNINLQFKKHDINKNTEITFNGGGHSGENSKISFKVGDNVPFIGGSTFTLDLPVSSHVTFLVSPDGKKMQLGLNFADLRDDNEHKTAQEQFDAAKKLLTDARTAANLKAGKLDNQQKKTFYSLLKGNSKKWTFFKDGEWNFLGYVEGDWSSDVCSSDLILCYSSRVWIYHMGSCSPGNSTSRTRPRGKFNWRNWL